MKVVIAGGTGFLGKELSKFFLNRNDTVVVFTRSKSRVEGGVEFINWDGTTRGAWTEKLIGSEILINLTGKSVDCRYTDANKKEIIRSRVDSTTILGEVVSKMEQPPKLWMNASTATIYRHSEDKLMTEENG